MNLALFGGTGRTGQQVLAQALAAGHCVRMLARNPDKVTIQHPNLTVIAGALTDAAAVTDTVRGADAVISTLGPAHNRPTFDVSKGVETIVAAMKAEGVQRLIMTAGAGVRVEGDQPGVFDRIMGGLLRLATANVVADMGRAVEIARASGLEWTVLRAPMLTDDAATGHVRLGAVGKDIGIRLARADFAAELLRQVNERAWIGKAPAISN